MDQRTRKLMTMHWALHPRDDVNRLYVSRKEGGRGPTIIQDSIEASIQRLDDYIKKRGGTLITPTRKNTDSTSINRINNEKTKNRKKNNSMDISSDKQAKSYTRKFGRG